MLLVIVCDISKGVPQFKRGVPSTLIVTELD